jgi:hypothetical protein
MALHGRAGRPLSVALSFEKIRYGQPLESACQGLALTVDKLRAWEVAVRLREQAARFRVACDIAETFPESRLALQVLEAGIQTTAKRLSVATNIAAMSLEGLIDALERYNTDVQMIRPWQV